MRQICPYGFCITLAPSISAPTEVAAQTVRRRRPLALQATAVLGYPCETVADVGSSHGEEVQTCLDAGIPPSVARPITSAT